MFVVLVLYVWIYGGYIECFCFWEGLCIECGLDIVW